MQPNIFEMLAELAHSVSTLQSEVTELRNRVTSLEISVENNLPPF